MKKGNLIAGLVGTLALAQGVLASNAINEELVCKIPDSAITYKVRSFGPDRTVHVLVQENGKTIAVLPRKGTDVAGTWSDLSGISYLLADHSMSDPDSNTVFKFKVKYDTKLKNYSGSINIGLGPKFGLNLFESGAATCTCESAPASGHTDGQPLSQCADPLQANLAPAPTEAVAPPEAAKPAQASAPVAVSSDFTNRAMLAYLPTSVEQEEYGGMRYIREVLKGVLWRGGGFAGDENPLKPVELDALCKQGFTSVDYAYIGQSPETPCAGNPMIYKSVPNAPSRASVFLADVYKAIKEGGKVMVHCWNGWHESGEMASYAIKQFCSKTPTRPNGWTTTQVQDYWKAAIGDKFQPAYEGIINNIGAMKIDPSLQITDEEFNRVCPSPN